jgi:hypothetical protein
MDTDVECGDAQIEASRDSEETLLITISGTWCIVKG